MSKKSEKCRNCPYRFYENNDIFRVSPTCYHQCKDNSAKKREKK